MLQKFYVGNISWDADEQDLADTFSQFGQVNSATIIFDKVSGRSKGFGFVSLECDSNRSFNGLSLFDRALVVRPYEERERPQPAYASTGDKVEYSPSRDKGRFKKPFKRKFDSPRPRYRNGDDDDNFGNR